MPSYTHACTVRMQATSPILACTLAALMSFHARPAAALRSAEQPAGIIVEVGLSSATEKTTTENKVHLATKNSPTAHTATISMVARCAYGVWWGVRHTGCMADFVLFQFRFWCRQNGATLRVPPRPRVTTQKQ